MLLPNDGLSTCYTSRVGPGEGHMPTALLAPLIPLPDGQLGGWEGYHQVTKETSGVT
jgi:hypothetical protein